MKFALFAAATLIGAASISSAAVADQLDDIKSAGTLNCGVLTNSPPLGFQDPKTREPAGYEIDLCGSSPSRSA
jgi:polar amino acid transport system substrate-binding protein